MFTQPHAECAEPHLWTATDDSASEDEVTAFLGALVHLAKPKLVVETGAYHGHTTATIAQALRDNGRGHVYGLEIDPVKAVEAQRRLDEQQLGQWATVVAVSSLAWEAPGGIDLAFLDAGAGWHRIREFRHLLPAMSDGSLVCVHDTARKNRLPRLGLEALAGQGALHPVFIRCPRGLMIGQPRRPRWLRRVAGAPRYGLVWAYTTLRAVAARARSSL